MHETVFFSFHSVNFADLKIFPQQYNVTQRVVLFTGTERLINTLIVIEKCTTFGRLVLPALGRI